MMIKGLKSKVEQITFHGDKHPTNGCVSEISWTKLVQHLEDVNDDVVDSIKITPRGLLIYWGTGRNLGRVTEI